MARRYNIEELLWLRDSPLVTKPDKLPPIEEWMGPIPDPTTRKPNHRDQNQNDNGTPRRPGLFEAGHVSRKSNSEDIVLGPPKTAFASASRMHGKGSYDATERPSRFNDTDEGKGDRLNFRDKFFKDREGGDRELDKRECRFVNQNGRRNDREDWNSGRPRRTFGSDENERPRRNGETNRWDSREKQDESGFTRTLRDKDGRFEKEGRFNKRDTPLRSRNEQSWFRDENAGEGADFEEGKEIRNRDWRRDKQMPDRDWNRGTRVEQDPEWMDSTEHDEPRQIHTQEDFQRWKERMKAGSATPAQADEEKKDAVLEQVSPDVQQAEANHLNGELFAASKSHLQVDAGFDKFFGLLGETKAAPAPETAHPDALESNKRDITSAKTSKASRFAGLFSPPPDHSARGPEKPPVMPEERPASADADQEGFQRILQMLGNSKSRNTTPQVDSTKQPRPPSHVVSEQNRPTPPPGLPSPSRNPINRQDEMMAAQENAAVAHAMQHPPGIGAPLASRDPQAHFNERENLLRLMQQVNITPSSAQRPNTLPPPQQLPQSGHTPGILNVPDLLTRPQGIQKVTRNQAFLDDPAIANMQRPDSGAKGQQARKPPVNGPGPMRFFDEGPFPGASQGVPGLNAPGATGSGREPHVPHSHLGLQRPPGFDQVPPGPPPGWAGQMPPQQGGALGPPPGIPNKGVNANFMGGPLSMHGANIPPPNENPQFVRGMSGAGSAGNFGLPPGMIPPPGYMNLNGPPPPSAGFIPGPGPGPGPHNPEAMVNVGGQSGFGGVAGVSSGPPPSSRHLLEMLAHANGGDGRGTMLGGGPGQFR